VAVNDNQPVTGLRAGNSIMNGFINGIDGMSDILRRRFLHNTVFFQYRNPMVMNALLPYYDAMTGRMTYYDERRHNILIDPFLHETPSNADYAPSWFFGPDDLRYITMLSGKQSIGMEQVMMLIRLSFMGAVPFDDGTIRYNGHIPSNIIDSIVASSDMDEARDVMLRFLNHTRSGKTVSKLTDEPCYITMPVARKTLADEGFDLIFNELTPFLGNHSLMRKKDFIDDQKWMTGHYSLRHIDLRSFIRAYEQCDPQKRLDVIYDENSQNDLIEDLNGFEQRIILDSPRTHQMIMCRGNIIVSINKRDDITFNAYALLLRLFIECRKRLNDAKDMMTMDDNDAHDIIAMVNEGVPMDYISEAFLDTASIRKP
jgi:hypothetical protein